MFRNIKSKLTKDITDEMLQQSYDTHYIALPEQDKQTTKRENTLEWGNSFY